MTSFRQRISRRSAPTPETTAADPAAASAPEAAPAPAPPATPTATPPVTAAPQPTPDAAPAATAEAAAPDAPPAEPAEPGFVSRGRLRRRLRYLRRVRELGYRDLGGLVYDQHRFARPNEALVHGKVAALAQIDGELRALEHTLKDRRATTELREAGIAACPRCGAIHGSEAQWCPACGLSLAGPTELAAMPSGSAPPAPVAATPQPAATPVPVPPSTPVAAAPQPAAQAAPPPPAAPPAPAPPAPRPDDTMLVPPGGDQPTKVLRASDVGARPVTGGDPLTPPTPAEAPVTSGDPLAPRGDDPGPPGA